MGNQQVGKQSFKLDNPPVISAWASVVGKRESEGPLANTFDVRKTDSYFGQKTWELAERRMQQIALQKLSEKAGMPASDFGMVFSGEPVAVIYGCRRWLFRQGRCYDIIAFCQFRTPVPFSFGVWWSAATNSTMDSDRFRCRIGLQKRQWTKDYSMHDWDGNRPGNQGCK